MNPRPFWKVSEVIPPLGVPVFVIWSGRGPFEAARCAHPRTGREAWAVRDGRDTFLLPLGRGDTDPYYDPKKPWAGWRQLTGAPDSWSPKVPAQWGLAMPAPAFLRDDSEPPRMWNERQAFDAVAAAEEMEADREAAGNRERRVERHLWWLDATQITYSEPGKITRREAEGRMMRHLAGWGAGAIDGVGLHQRSLLRFMSNDQLRELAEADANTPPSFVPFEPLPQDRGDKAAPDWFATLSFDRSGQQAGYGNGYWSQAQSVLIGMADVRGLTIADVGRALGISRQRAHQLATETFERVWVIANEFDDKGRDARAAALAAIKSENRSFALNRGT